MDESSESQEFLTVRQAAELLAFTERRVRQLLKSGSIQGRRIGKRWRIHISEINRYLSIGDSPEIKPPKDGEQTANEESPHTAIQSEAGLIEAPGSGSQSTDTDGATLAPTLDDLLQVGLSEPQAVMVLSQWDLASRDGYHTLVEFLRNIYELHHADPELPWDVSVDLAVAKVVSKYLGGWSKIGDILWQYKPWRSENTRLAFSEVIKRLKDNELNDMPIKDSRAAWALTASDMYLLKCSLPARLIGNYLGQTASTWLGAWLTRRPRREPALPMQSVRNLIRSMEAGRRGFLSAYG